MTSLAPTDRPTAPPLAAVLGVWPGASRLGGAWECDTAVVRRHLTLSEVKAALRRGSEVEQLIRFGEPVDGRAALTYVWLSGGSPVTGRLEHCFDDGSPSFFDVGEFLDVEDDAEDAWTRSRVRHPTTVCGPLTPLKPRLSGRASECDANDERWVNQGVIDAEYRDAKGW